MEKYGLCYKYHFCFLFLFCSIYPFLFYFLPFFLYLKFRQLKIQESIYIYHLTLHSQEHCTDQVTGFPIRKLFLIPLITFFGNFATLFGNNFLLLQHFLIRKLLLDKVILPSCQPQNSEFKCHDESFTELFLKKMGDFSILKT